MLEDSLLPEVHVQSSFDYWSLITDSIFRANATQHLKNFFIFIIKTFLSGLQY